MSKLVKVKSVYFVVAHIVSFSRGEGPSICIDTTAGSLNDGLINTFRFKFPTQKEAQEALNSLLRAVGGSDG